jgi:hypothetical protein
MNVSTTAPTELHRHVTGTHVEDELRYYRPLGFRASARLAGLELALTRANPHTDHYFDAAASDEGPLLRARGCSLRIRCKPTGEVLATFKRKLASVGARCQREENEQAIECGPSDERDGFSEIVEYGDASPLLQARVYAGTAPLQRMFTISNDRIDHHYKSGEAHVVLSEDHLTFSDGSCECRIEVEFVAGDKKLLDRIDAALRKRYTDLVVCKRGKLSEGRRRHAALLGCSTLSTCAPH